MFSLRHLKNEKRKREKQGAGTALKNILTELGIRSAPNCSCNAMAAKMDANGVEWCADHVDEIVATMEEAANKRGWLRFVPFKEVGAEGLVRLAISRAKK